jgi:hypothetical protein
MNDHKTSGEEGSIVNDYCQMHHLLAKCTFSPDHLMGEILTKERGRLCLGRL